MDYKERLEAGWSAFPSSNALGMTLRDWFAGQALVGIIAVDRFTGYAKSRRESGANMAYEYADAMLVARETSVNKADTSNK